MTARKLIRFGPPAVLHSGSNLGESTFERNRLVDLKKKRETLSYLNNCIEMDPISAVSEELGEIEGQINDLFRALS